MKSINKYIEFEAQIHATPLSLFGGAVDNKEENNQQDSDGYKVATAEDIDLFASFLDGF